MLGKLIGKAIVGIATEVVKAPVEMVDAAVTELTEPCTCSKHKWDPSCPRHGRDS